jgi:BASS family bile acid:Na+ symporter
MLNFRDWLLLIASLSSVLAGIIWPEYGAPFRPFPIYCMMALLFFSFLPIRLGAIFSSVRSSLPDLGRYVFIKLILLPLLVFFSFRYMFPKYAVAALILSGISSGVSSPFFAVLVQANISLVFAMVVVSSILVPFTLPVLAHILVGKYMEISLFAMSRLLGLVIFCPLILAEILKRFAPDFTAKLSKAQYSVALVSFVVTNVGIFSQCAAFLREEPSTVLISLGVSTILAAAYFVAGMLFSLGRPLPDHLSLIIIFGFINNVLAIVLSSEFFRPLEATVAAMYTIPFFGLIVPLRLYQNWARKHAGP